MNYKDQAETGYASGQLGQQKAYQQDQQGYGQAARAYSPEEIIDTLFTYQPPTPATLPKFLAIREAGKYFAKVLAQNVPPGTDLLNAVLKVREAVMLANAGVSLNGEQL